MKLETLSIYLEDFNKASSDEEKWNIAKKYNNNDKIIIEVSIIAGEYIDNFWVIKGKLQNVNNMIARIAIDKRKEGTNKNHLVQVIDDFNVIKKTGAALIRR